MTRPRHRARLLLAGALPWTLAAACARAAASPAASPPVPSPPVGAEAAAEAEGAAGGQPRALPLAAVVEGRVTPGTRVRVSGRCLGDDELLAPGAPPRTRSDWQLGDGRAAVFVSGPRPAECPPRGGSTARVTIDGVVRVDTLPALGSRPGGPRYYLTRGGPQRTSLAGTAREALPPATAPRPRA